MDWVPETIRALTAMLHEGGPWGVVTFIFALGAFGVAIIMALAIWKNLAAILAMGERFFTARIITDHRVVEVLESIKDSNKKTEESNQQILDRVHKLPSDVPICRAKSSDELEAMLKEKFASRGFDLTDAEIAIILQHREDLKKVMVESGAFPKVNLEDGPLGAKS